MFLAADFSLRGLCLVWTSSVIRKEQGTRAGGQIDTMASKEVLFWCIYILGGRKESGAKVRKTAKWRQKEDTHGLVVGKEKRTY